MKTALKSIKKTLKKKEDENHIDAIVDFSVTVVSPGRDLPRHAFSELQNFLERESSAGLFGYERGGQEQNGHAQGVVR